MSVRALAPDGRLLTPSRCRDRTPSGRPRRAAAAAAAAENPVETAALSAANRLRDSLLAAGRSTAVATPPPALAAAGEENDWLAWEHYFDEADSQGRLIEALQVRAGRLACTI